MSYLNLGRETSKDLVVLCEGCHNDVHELAFTKRVDLAVAHRSLAWKRSGKTDGMRVVQLPPGVRNRPGKGRKPRWAKPGPTLNLGPRKRSLKEVEEENRRLEIFQKIAKKNREVRHR